MIYLFIYSLFMPTFHEHIQLDKTNYLEAF